MIVKQLLANVKERSDFLFKLKEIRVEKGLTQQDLANLLNISRQALSQIENESYKINVNMLCKLADILEVTTDDLLGRPDSHKTLEQNWKTLDNITNR